MKPNRKEQLPAKGITHCLQMRKPLIPSTITSRIKIFIRRRLVTASTVCRAALVSRHGIKMEAPFLNARQFTSYLTPSTNIGGFLGGHHEAIHVEEARN